MRQIWVATGLNGQRDTVPLLREVLKGEPYGPSDGQRPERFERLGTHSARLPQAPAWRRASRMHLRLAESRLAASCAWGRVSRTARGHKAEARYDALGTARETRPRVRAAGTV